MTEPGKRTAQEAWIEKLAGILVEKQDQVRIVTHGEFERMIAEAYHAHAQQSGAPAETGCSSDAIDIRDALLERWCDSWNVKIPNEKQYIIQRQLFDETNRVLVEERPPLDKLCVNCHSAYGRGMERASELAGEYLDRKGLPPANGRGLYLRLDDALDGAAASPVSEAPPAQTCPTCGMDIRCIHGVLFQDKCEPCEVLNKIKAWAMGAEAQTKEAD